MIKIIIDSSVSSSVSTPSKSSVDHKISNRNGHYNSLTVTFLSPMGITPIGLLTH